MNFPLNQPILTKEQWLTIIQSQQNHQAELFGLTLEQYQHAVISGSVIQSS